MKTTTATIICLFLLATSWAQCQQPVQIMAAQDIKRVTLELKDTPLKAAIEQVLQLSAAKYRMDPALDKAPYNRILVSVRLENVPFTDALTSLLQTHGLTLKIEDSVGVIYPVVTDMNVPRPVMVAATMPNLDLVTMYIPRMTIAEALAYLYRDARIPVSWTFQNWLGAAIMPGANFYQFPRDEASDVLLAAAGLLPPTGPDGLVKSRGTVNLSKVISYVPLGSYFVGYSMPRPIGFPPAVAVAAYQTANSPQPLLIVLANQEQTIVVLDRVLATSGVNYIMGNTGGQLVPMAPAQQSDAVQAPIGVKLVSIRLYGVTLEQALKSVLPAVNLRYRMEGPQNAPTMIIETVPPR